MNQLFLICPECYIEQALRNKYGANNFFLTALGTVFNIDEFEYAEEVNSLISKEEIDTIYIVNDISCTFIQNVVSQNAAFQTKAELTLNQLFLKNKVAFKKLTTAKEKGEKLAKLNIYRQAYALLDVAFIGMKIEDNGLKLKGLIYDRKDGSFKEIEVRL